MSLSSITIPTESSITITAKIYHPDEKLFGDRLREEAHLSPREKFWARAVPSLSKEEGGLTRESILHLENEVRENLGKELKEGLVEDFPSRQKLIKEASETKSIKKKSASWWNDILARLASWFGPAEPPILPPVPKSLEDLYIETKILGYSSMEVALGLSAAEPTIQFIESYFEIFRVALDGLLPGAFRAAVPEIDSATPFGAEVETAVSDGTSLYHSSAGGNRGGIRQMPNNKKSRAEIIAEYLRLVLNATLIVPVLLSLWVLNIAFNKLGEWRNDQSNEYKEIIQTQKQIIEEDRNRIQILFDRLLPKPENPPVNTSKPPPPDNSGSRGGTRRRRSRRSKSRHRQVRQRTH